MASLKIPFGRRIYHLHEERGGWLLRSRRRGEKIHEMFYGSKRKVRGDVLAWLDERHPAPTKAERATLEKVVGIYLALPKRAGEKTAAGNVSRLRTIAKVALGRPLKDVLVSEAGPKLWREFQRKKQGGTLDLSTRWRENTPINAAIRTACSIFTKNLAPAYAEHGIKIPDNVTTIQWLPELKKIRKPKADDAGLQAAWQKLPRGALYFAVGIGRWSALRRKEVSFARTSWLSQRGDTWGFEVRDRPEEGFHHKTGEEYFAPIIDEGFLKELQALPEGLIVLTPEGVKREKWFATTLLEWVRPFMGGARLPFHGLRGLMATDLQQRTEGAELARQKGVQAAADALGHTTTKTTKDHYLSDD